MVYTIQLIFILKGSDQYRGWFNSSLITSVAVTGKAPYKEVLSQGFVLDDKGHKMSKSLGNVISPNDVIKKMGAEIIRLWVAQADTTSDVAVSMGILQQSAESYRKIRNTFRYMLANTSDFDPKENRVAYADLRSVDQYMEVKLNDLVKDCLAAYDKFDFTTVFKKVFNLFLMIFLHFILILLRMYFTLMVKTAMIVAQCKLLFTTLLLNWLRS